MQSYDDKKEVNPEDKANGKRLRDARKKCGYSQEELSELSGVATKYISRLENGHIHITDEQARKLCPPLGVTMEFIYGMPLPDDEDKEKREAIKTIAVTMEQYSEDEIKRLNGSLDLVMQLLDLRDNSDRN